MWRLFRTKKSPEHPVPRGASGPRIDPGVQYGKVRQAFGIEVSDAALKAVEFVWRKRAYVLQAHSRVDLPRGVVDHGEIRHPETLVASLQTLLTSARPRPITTRHVLLAFPEAHVYLHPFVFAPTLTETQVRRAVLYEAEAELPITLSEVTTDVLFHRAREEERGYHILFAAAPSQLVESYVRVLAAAQLKPVAVEVESLALTRCLIQPQADPLLLLDIGAWSSTISTVERGMVHGAVSIPIGGSTLTEVLASTLTVSLEEAERLKCERGLEGIPQEAAQALMGLLRSLAEEVRKAAAYHEEHTGRPVRTLILSGGTTRLKGLLPFLQKETAFSLTVGDPFSTHPIQFSSLYTEEDRAQFQEDVAMYVSTLGLAERGADPEIATSGLNLLPPPIRRRYEQWREHLALAGFSGLAAVLVLASAILFGFWSVPLLAERSRIVSEAALLRTSLTVSEVQRTVAEAEEANKEIALVRELEVRRFDVGRIIRELRAEVLPAIRLTTLQVSASGERDAPVTLQIMGIAERREVLLDFERRLRAHAGVTKVDAPLSNLERPVDTPFTFTVTVARHAAASPPPPVPVGTLVDEILSLRFP